jgi:hypothetical protein
VRYGADVLQCRDADLQRHERTRVHGAGSVRDIIGGDALSIYRAAAIDST